MRRALAGAILLATAAGFGCAHGGEADIATLTSNSDQVIWEAGQKALEGRNWEAARQHFKRIIEGFPQSELGPQARLALADSYFGEGGTANYILAVAQYREFLTLFPSHPRSDYAQFQVGESHFRQKNSPDRDQTSTEKALEEFQRLLELYPSSSYAEKARGRIVACRQSLALAEFGAGYFYQKTRQACHASVRRYQGMLTDYPDFERLDEVLYRLGQCLVEMGRPAEALPHLQHLLDSYPRSSFAADARTLVARAVQLAGPPLALPTPSPEPAPSPSPSPSPSPRPQVSL